MKIWDASALFIRLNQYMYSVYKFKSNMSLTLNPLSFGIHRNFFTEM